MSCKPSTFFLFLIFCCQAGFSGLGSKAPDFFAIRIFVPSTKYPNLVFVAFLLKEIKFLDKVLKKPCFWIYQRNFGNMNRMHKRLDTPFHFSIWIWFKSFHFLYKICIYSFYLWTFLFFSKFFVLYWSRWLEPYSVSCRLLKRSLVFLYLFLTA